MNFFEQLSQQPDVDITLRIMGKEGRLTVNILPGSHTSKTKPVVFTGTGAELDQAFFTDMLPAEKEVRALESNVELMKKQIEEEAKANTVSAKPAAKPEKAKDKKPAKPARDKEPKKAEPEIVEDKLFEV